MSENYQIRDLAKKAGVTNRTVHYYVARGLLPPPDGAGVGTTYREEHLLRLQLIKRLQEQYLPLDKIRQILTGLGPEELRQALEGKKPTYSKEMECVYYSQNEALSPEQKQRCAVSSSLIDHIDDLRSLPTQTNGTAYIRSDLGSGLELHVPADLLRDKPDLIDRIKKFTWKLIDGE